jgi:hypothetical protein
MNRINRRIGRALASFLQKQTRYYTPFGRTPTAELAACLQPCDVLLVEGDRRISSAIKYLTHSTWSHSAIYIRDQAGSELIEADLETGVQRASLDSYAHLNTRICRPQGLTADQRQAVVEYMENSLGRQYDLKNVIDLARYLFPLPPVPHRFRRRMLAVGSGDPTRAICSTVIAEAFHHVHYPVLPEIRHIDQRGSPHDVLHVRHHSLFAPRDFDLSPYFEVIKPPISPADYRELYWNA